MRVILQDIEYLNKVLFAVSCTYISYIIQFIQNDLLMLVKEFNNVVIVIVECVPVDISFSTKLGNSNA